MRTPHWNLALPVILALTLALGCQREAEEMEVEEPAETATRTEAPMEVAEVQLGRTATNNRITDPVETFGPRDTIFAAVRTENTPAGTQLLARWIHKADGEEHLIAEEPHTTAQAGTGWTSFYAANANPWPAGDYELRILSNGEVLETKAFTVEDGA